MAVVTAEMTKQKGMKVTGNPLQESSTQRLVLLAFRLLGLWLRHLKWSPNRLFCLSVNQMQSQNPCTLQSETAENLCWVKALLLNPKPRTPNPQTPKPSTLSRSPSNPQTLISELFTPSPEAPKPLNPKTKLEILHPIS